jgi:hypothetical protein
LTSFHTSSIPKQSCLWSESVKESSWTYGFQTKEWNHLENVTKISLFHKSKKDFFLIFFSQQQFSVL